jgi:predicted dehydrogenase
MMTTKKYNIAVIGAGMWAPNHLRMFQEEERSQVTWVCAETQASIEAAQQKFHIPQGTRDYRELLKDPAVDAVVIASPPHTHVQMAIDALQAGKHVLLEKPMATTRSSMYRLMAEAEKHPDQVLLECSCRHARLQPKYDFVKNFIQSGKLGEVYHIHYNFLVPETFIEYNPRGQWAMRKKTAGGGPFLDFAVYELSFLLGVLGDKHQLRSVRAFHRNDLRDLSALVPGADVEQHGAAYLEFDLGLTMYLERGAGAIAQVPSQTRIHGTKGTLLLEWPTWTSHEMSYFSLDKDGRVQKETLVVDMAGHPANDNGTLVSHFLNCLDGTARPEMPIIRAAKHLDILLRILK